MKWLRLLNPMYLYKRRIFIWFYFKSKLNLLRHFQVFMALRGKPLIINDKKLAALKDKHKGNTAFLIGNGPSVEIKDLEKLQNIVSFCCNRFYLAYDKMKFRPTYTVSADLQMIEDFGAEIVKNSDGTVFLATEECPNIPEEFIWVPVKHKRRMAFSESVYDYVLPWGSTLVAAIQIGYFMGIKKFVLYGMDHEFKFMEKNKSDKVYRGSIGEGNHFIENYRSEKSWSPPQFEKIEEAFKVCNNFLRAKGGWVKNATRGGKMEILERVDFDSVINED